ncbi:MAG: SAM-dependent methyltransferase [Cyanobacteria bacterium P01_C01_bin.89]
MELASVVPWGRNLAEYQAMFNLSAADLRKTILGCGDGPASFNGEMAQQGRRVISVDPIYAFSAHQIQQRVEGVYDTVIAQVKAQSKRFVWRNFADADDLGRARWQTMTAFLDDYDRGKADGRYQAQSLPALDFSDQEFELCLCSHLLFLYSEKLSAAFHWASLRELLRVAAEVRVFPLLTLAGDRSPHLEPLLSKLHGAGHRARIHTVDYEFQRGGNEMLIITGGA